MKIILTGSQGTGKSTILNYYKEQFPVITEVVRNLSKKGVKINELGDEKGQHKIFSTYVNLFKKKNFISDRGLTDVYAYSTYHFNQGKLSLDELSYEMGELETLAKEDILWVYFPIEFGVVDDGVRSVDEDYRRYIDQAIKQTLDDVGIKYLTVHGTVGERINQINEYIKEHENRN